MSETITQITIFEAGILTIPSHGWFMALFYPDIYQLLSVAYRKVPLSCGHYHLGYGIVADMFVDSWDMFPDRFYVYEWDMAYTDRIDTISMVISHCCWWWWWWWWWWS